MRFCITQLTRIAMRPYSEFDVYFERIDTAIDKIIASFDRMEKLTQKWEK